MDLTTLEGNIIGVISDEFKKEDFEDKTVAEIIGNKVNQALQMVNLDSLVKNKKFQELSSSDKSKVILASKLHQKVIILYDFTKGLNQKDLAFYKRLFKKIISYNKKIVLVSKDARLFINNVDKIYVINNQQIIYETDSIFDKKIYEIIDAPGIVNFFYQCENMGIHLDEYTDINELIKAIYRIKT